MTDLNQTSAWLHAVLDKVRDERGFSVSSEQLWWLVGIVAIVGVVMLALNGYIEGLLAKL
ncbi:MAG: hypothetical protein IT193_11580 [Propionibacteriaceae bacterium]|jgi:hypothetical protein|nr:hypothetical protein [Propionibacteriaceae bacterium]